MKNNKTFLFLLIIFSILLTADCSTSSNKPKLKANKVSSTQAAPKPVEPGKTLQANTDEKISPNEEKRSDVKQVDQNLKDRKSEGETKESQPQVPQNEATKGEEKKEEETLINVEDVSIAEFSELVFSEILKRNYEMAPELKESQTKITVRMTKSVPRTKIIYLVSEILKQYDIYIYEKEDTYHIVPAKEIGSITPKFKYGKAVPKVSEELGVIFQVIPLDYITSSQIDFMIRRYLSKVGVYTVEGVTNSLMIIDYPERIEKILEIIQLLDKEFFKDVILKIIKPTFWEPSALTKQINELLKIESIPVLKPQQPPHGIFLLPIDRLREIYIFSSSQEWLDRILFFVENLDKPEALGGDERTFIYFPVNTSAQDLGGVVSQIFGAVETPAAISEKQPQATPQTKFYKKIIIDERRNCLIFVASPSDWATIKGLLEKLDIPSRQVLIEAVIGEITLDDQFRMGVEWFMKNYNLKIQKKEFTGQGGTEGNVGLGGLGFLYTLVAEDDLFRAAVNAFISQNRIKIISAPRIIGTDNKEAVIRIGTEVPVVTSEAVTGQIQMGGTTGMLRSIQYRSTGVILSVTPTIHSGGVVSLEISQEVSEAQTNTISPEIQSPMILNRSIKTSLIAKNGETIFIGGLISKNISSTKTGVPILSSIPILGSLFKSTSQSERRTELIVLITPHILSETSELDFITEEFRSKMMQDIKKISIKEIREKKDENK
jgi:general secretion pathway protein D